MGETEHTGPIEELPLFPLGLVLVPGELRPLHIFEERYRNLVADIRDQGGSFGIVLSLDPGLAATGCTARLAAVLDEFDDGRLNIVVRGVQRFHLHETRTPPDPSLTPLQGLVTLLDDPQVEVSAAYEQQAKKFFRRILDLGGEKAKPITGDLPISYAIAGQIDLDPTLKQRLLDLDDENDRLRILVASLEHIASRLQLLKEREEAIRGNGKGT